MPYIEHPLDAPNVAGLLRDLDRVQTRREWDGTVGLLVLQLCILAGARDWVPAMGSGATKRTDEGDVARMVALGHRLALGPPKGAPHRAPATLQAERDADFLSGIAAHVPTPAAAARLFVAMAKGVGVKLSYDAALKRARRAMDQGGFRFARAGTRFRRPATE